MPKPQASETNSHRDDDDDEMEAEHKAEILALEVSDDRQTDIYKRPTNPCGLATRLKKLH